MTDAPVCLVGTMRSFILIKVWDVRGIRSQLLHWPRLPGNGVSGRPFGFGAVVCRPFGFGAVVRAPDVAAPVTCIALDAKPPSCRGIKSGVVTFLVVDVAVVGVAALRF